MKCVWHSKCTTEQTSIHVAIQSGMEYTSKYSVKMEVYMVLRHHGEYFVFFQICLIKFNP